MHYTTFHLRTRPRMYVVVAMICGLSALLIELFISGTSDLRDHADRHIDSAVRRAVRTEAADAYKQVEPQ